MSTALYNEAWQILSDMEDVVLDHVGDDVRGARRLLDRCFRYAKLCADFFGGRNDWRILR